MNRKQRKGNSKVRALFLANTFVFLGSGLACVLIPVRVASFFGGGYGLHGALTAQLLGAAILSLAVLTWLGRNARESEVRHAIILALFVAWTLTFLLTLKAQLDDLLNFVGWITAAVALAFAAAYGYLQIKT